MKANALICTVGTSMFGRMPELRHLSVAQAAARLRDLVKPSDGGAEFETLHYHCRSEELIELQALVLFCSDTDEGITAGRILEAAFSKEFQHIEVTRCKGLRDDDPRVFVTRGLRCLVNQLVAAIHRLRKRGWMPAIDATGGYKPQIAHAVLVGQIMQVPVYYRYQGFPEVIELPPLPISMDPQVWFDHLWFFERLREELLPDRDLPHGDGRIAPLLEREEHLVMLSPLGELMAAAADQLLTRGGGDLLPPPSPDLPAHKPITYEDDNAGKHAGLADFCERLRSAPFVTHIATFYFNPDLPRPSSVRVPKDAEGTPGRLEAWYGDGKGLTKLNVWTSATTSRELSAARADLASRLGTLN